MEARKLSEMPVRRLTPDEKNLLVKTIKDLSFAFTADRQQWSHWLHSENGAGFKYRDEVNQFNASLKVLLEKQNAEDEFPKAIQAILDEKDRDTLSKGNVGGQFLERYPSITFFLYLQFIFNPHLAEANLAFWKYFVEYCAVASMYVDHNVLLLDHSKQIAYRDRPKKSEQPQIVSVNQPVAAPTVESVSSAAAIAIKAAASRAISAISTNSSASAKPPSATLEEKKVDAPPPLTSSSRRQALGPGLQSVVIENHYKPVAATQGEVLTKRVVKELEQKTLSLRGLLGALIGGILGLVVGIICCIYPPNWLRLGDTLFDSAAAGADYGSILFECGMRTQRKNTAPSPVSSPVRANPPIETIAPSASKLDAGQAAFKTTAPFAPKSVQPLHPSSQLSSPSPGRDGSGRVSPPPPERSAAHSARIILGLQFPGPRQ